MTHSEAIVLDFDNTLTKTDSIKFLILCLLIHRVHVLPYIIRQFVRYKHGKESAETMKHSIIGALIKGKSDESLSISLRLFKALVHLVRRKNIYEIMVKHINRGDTVIIATASPYFAVSFLLQEYGIPVLGTKYHKENNFYTGQVCNPIPFGKQKALLLQAMLSDMNVSTIEAAYSDSQNDLPLLSMARESYLIDSKGHISKALF